MHPAWVYDFFQFLADLGECPEGLSIERDDPNGNYEPGNVRWATDKEQRRSRTDNVYVEHEGAKIVLKDYAKLRGVNYKSLHYLTNRRGKTAKEAADHLSSKPPSSAKTRTMAAS
jgi:hypothetical protein